MPDFNDWTDDELLDAIGCGEYALQAAAELDDRQDEKDTRETQAYLSQTNHFI